MSHRHLSGKMARGLSKWDTEKANRLFIHVLIWWLFLSLLSYFHFKCQRTSFGLCQNAPHGDREEVVTALTDYDGNFRETKISVSFSCKLCRITLWTQTKLGKKMDFLIVSPTWECLKEKKSRACGTSGGLRSCVMADDWKPGKWKRKIVSIALFVRV